MCADKIGNAPPVHHCALPMSRPCRRTWCVAHNARTLPRRTTLSPTRRGRLAVSERLALLLRRRYTANGGLAAPCPHSPRRGESCVCWHELALTFTIRHHHPVCSRHAILCVGATRADIPRRKAKNTLDRWPCRACLDLRSVYVASTISTPVTGCSCSSTRGTSTVNRWGKGINPVKLSESVLSTTLRMSRVRVPSSLVRKPASS